MNKDVTFHINNLAYTITVDEELRKKSFVNILVLSKNNDTKELLIAYLEFKSRV